MTILSSKRIIKQTDMSKQTVIEQYLPPLEDGLNNRAPVPRKPVFPRYTEAELKKEYIPPRLEEPEEEPEVLEEPKEEPEWLEVEEPENPEDSQEAMMEAAREEARQEAEKILEEARAQAADILEAARTQARSARDQARRAGYQAGYEEGQQEGQQAAQEEVRQRFQNDFLEFQEDMKKAFRAVDKAKEECLHAYLEELKDCAVAIGEKVIHISLKSSGEVIKQMIVSATEKLKKTAWVKIYIDKYDYDMMMKADADVLEELSHLSDNIKFIVMDKEEDGSCIIEMPEEIIDISVNTQIENIRDILENIRI